MSEKLYKMSDVAKLHGITKKTLRYYDKINLFKPDKIDGINNYNYYNRKNFPILKQIIYLKDIGFSLAEIKNLLENRTHDLMISELTNRKNIVEMELTNLERTKASIDHLIHFYKVAKEVKENDLYRPSIHIKPQKNVIQLQAETYTKEGVMLAYRKILNSLRDLNRFSHQPYGTFYFNDNSEIEKVGAFIELPTYINLENQQILQGGKYITMYHKGSYISSKNLIFFNNWLKENNYTPIGNYYDYCIIDKSFTKDEDKMIQEITVRVK